MQINLVSNIYKTNISEYKNPQKNITITKPDVRVQQPVNFMGAVVVKKTITSQIAHEKSKLLRQFNEILAQNVPKLSPREKIIAQIKRAHAIAKMTIRKEEEIEREINFLAETNMLNAQQKMDRAQQLKKEFARLSKIKLIEDIEEKQPAKDNYDYALINKFKNAVLNNNFDLETIYKEHYKELENISTIEEFKEKYPSIRIPTEPKEVVVQKILDTLNRAFYLDLDYLFKKENEEAITFCLFQFFNKYFERLAEQYEGKTSQDLLDLFGKKVIEKVLQTYTHLREFDDFESIPENRKTDIAQISDTDKKMLELNFDELVISTLKKIYLEGTKLNQIKYSENNQPIDIISIKSPEYRFEKNPEKIKRIITDARKPAQLQKDYQNFTVNELQERLEHFYNTKLSNNEKIFNTIVDFASCKFTEEDKQYLIKFLKVLDYITEKKTSLEDGLNILEKNKIHPQGTIKLNEIERKAVEEKIKLEQQKKQALNDLREEFNNSINRLYELNLSDIAETFSKYYPENYEESTINDALKAIQIIKDNTNIKDKTKIRSKILRLEFFNDYSTKQANSEEFINASKYAEFFDETEKEDKIGQYLINREIIDNYPNSKNMFPKPKTLEKIMQKFNYDKNLATFYLCKYEDYLFLDENEQQSILKILEIFDVKNPNDRVVLKNIIENDYINSDTTLKNIRNSYSTKTTITAIAKKEIYEKYKFPGCVELFEAFENAMTSVATEYGTSGIKKTGSNNNSLDYKIELKIIGYPDRLFSSNNDYIFDVYSEKGLH